jgi:hypothetical protein
MWSERGKVEAPVHCAATSIRVELSRSGEVKELLGDYPRISGIMCNHKSKTVPRVDPDIRDFTRKKVGGVDLGRIWR